MADYTKTTWNTGDIIDATKINNLETQYDTAKAAQRGGEWTMTADLDINNHGINGVTDINNGAVLLTDGDLEIADNKAYKIGGLSVISDPVSSTGRFAKDNGTWAIPTIPYSAPPDYLIYKESTTYYAKNMRTGEIDSSGTTASTVIQYACDHVPTIDTHPGGTIEFMNAEYTITTQINVPAGVTLIGNDSKMDCSGLNDVCFYFNVSGTQTWLWGAITGMKGFYFSGHSTRSTNPLSQCAYFDNITYSVMVEDCVALRMNYGVTIANSTWLARVSGFHMQQFDGIGIDIVSTISTDTANGTEIFNCDIESGGSSAIGIRAIGSTIHNLEEIKILNCWLEMVKDCIQLSGYHCIVSGCRISGSTDYTGILLAISTSGTGGGMHNGENNLITGNLFSTPTGNTCAIDIQTNGYQTQINENVFTADSGITNIRCATYENYLIVCNNKFMGGGKALSAKCPYLVFNGNSVNGTTGVEVLGGSDMQTITGNTFFLNTNAIIDASTATISGNSFTTVTGGVLVSATYSSYVGNKHENCSSSTSLTSSCVVIGNSYQDHTGTFTLTNSHVRDNIGGGTSIDNYSVLGPASVTDQSIAIFDDATGKILDDIAVPVASNQYLKCAGTSPVSYEWATPSASASYVGPFDYYVYKSGATYYARNCQTGAEDYSNANFVTLMGSVLTAVPDAAIELAANTTFSVAAGGLPLYGNHGVRLCGASEYTTVIQASGSCSTGVVDVRSANAVIQNLTIDGNAQSTTVGLSVGSIGGDGRYAYHSSFQNLRVEGCSTAGIQLWDDCNYIDFTNIKCQDDHSGYGLEFRGDASSDYNSGQITFYNCVISGPLGAVRRSWTAGGTMKGVAFYGCDFQDGHSGTYQVDCTGIYNILFSRCIFEVATNGKASTSQIRLNGYNQVFDTCSFAFRDVTGSITFVTNGTSYASALNAGYTFIAPKFYNMRNGPTYYDVAFNIGGGTIICPSREACDSGSNYYSATTLANCTIFDPNNIEGVGVNRVKGSMNQTGSLYINSNLSLSDPGTSTGKVARDDGSWVQDVSDEFKYIVYKSGTTYYAYDTYNKTTTSNATFSTLISGLITTTGVTIKLLPGTYTVSSTIAVLGTSYAGGRLVGASEYSTILQASTGLTSGIIRIGCDNWEIENVTFDGNNQSGCVGLRMGDIAGENLYTALRCSVKDSTFKNFSAGSYPTCLKLDGNTYYENFENLRMMDNNLYCVHFNDDTSGLGDNGQTLFSNCEIAANYYCVWRTAASATRHRIEFDRCGFYCGSTSSTYAVDFAGINNLHVNNCDFEATATPTTAFVGVGGQNQVFTACSLYANGIPLFKSHWGGTNSGLVFDGMQVGGNSTTSLFDIDYAFTVIEPNVDPTFAGKWFANTTTKRRCTVVGGQTQRLPPNNAWVQLKDDFQGASLNTYLWSTANCGSGATVTMFSDALGGVARIATGSTINTTGVLDNGTMDNLGFAAYPSMEAVVKLSASPTSVVHFIGLYTDSTHYLGFRIDTAVSTNWYAVCCNGGSETATSLGVAGDTTLRYLRFYMEPSTDTAIFYIDDQYKATLAATNMPVTGVCSIRASCKTLASADKNLDIDLIDVRYRRNT